MKHTYHYCITLSYYLWNNDRHYDGIISLGSKVLSTNSYEKLKEELLSEHSREYSSSVNITINSLNYLGSTD